MELLGEKIFIAFLFLFEALLFTLLPFCLGRRAAVVESGRSTKTRCLAIMDLSNSFAGGVFLSTCFAALLPFVRKSFVKGFILKQWDADYPVAEMTLIAGFFLMIFIEQIVIHMIQTKTVQCSGDDEGQSLMSESESEEIHLSRKGQTGHSHNSVTQAKSLLHSAALVVALGLHTLFEGMAMGLLSHLHTLFALVGAVSIHKTLCSVALGINLSKQAIKWKPAIVICVVFSLMMPVGICIGIGLNNIEGFLGILISCTLQGLATGTFMYVVFLEMLPSILSARKPVIQLLFMFFGALCMIIVLYFAHDHEDLYITAFPQTNSSTTVISIVNSTQTVANTTMP